MKDAKKGGVPPIIPMLWDSLRDISAKSTLGLLAPLLQSCAHGYLLTFKSIFLDRNDLVIWAEEKSHYMFDTKSLSFPPANTRLLTENSLEFFLCDIFAFL